MTEKANTLRTAIWSRFRDGQTTTEIAAALKTDERIVELIVNAYNRLESKRRSEEMPLPGMKEAAARIKLDSQRRLHRSERLRLFRSYLLALLGLRRGMVRLMNGITESQARAACRSAERSGPVPSVASSDDICRAMVESAFAAVYRRTVGERIFDEANVPYILEAWGKTIEAFGDDVFSPLHPYLDDPTFIFETALRIREGVKVYGYCDFCQNVYLTSSDRPKKEHFSHCPFCQFAHLSGIRQK